MSIYITYTNTIGIGALNYARRQFAGAFLPGVSCLTGTLSKPRRQGQRKCNQTKGLMSRTMVVHVRYKSMYISLSFSTQPQPEIGIECLRFVLNLNRLRGQQAH